MEANKKPHESALEQVETVVRGEDTGNRRAGTEPCGASIPSPLKAKDLGNKPDIVRINQAKPLSVFKVEMIVQGQAVSAVVDTAAEITLISDRLCQSFQVHPPILRPCRIATAGRELSMEGIVIGPVEMQLGTTVYVEDIYVAPIEDDMLLGFDFLKKYGAKIDMQKGVLILSDDIIKLHWGKDSGEPKVARVTVIKRCIVPPNSVMRVRCSLDSGLGDYMVQQEEPLKVMIPHTVHKGGDCPLVCMVNSTDHYITLKRGKCVAAAYEIEGEVQAPAYVEARLRQASERAGTERASQVSEVPEHIRVMLESSREHLTEAQVDRLTETLCEFQDVFAQNEFDLGNFTDIEHTIDTGDAKPIKQRMRRTPLCFVGEEETHLKKMLSAGVIQPSVSDWASAPVLIRKRDGAVRWCIDYRALNNVTVKDVFPLPLVEDCLDTLAGKQWFSKLDANSAYWQIGIKDEDRKKTAFTTKYGLLEWASGFAMHQQLLPGSSIWF
ncbi:MAG: reverse transcriptase family protein [Candidatus Thiodiazotropha sp. (ex Lucinoma aequizonata)]|nr:reverse transcriptase family protein [Candidatus Thiodiazotropha sp. (ex Lucinoma aequizonata)]